MFAAALPTTGVTLQTRRAVTTAATKPREQRGGRHRGLWAGLGSQQQHAWSPGSPAGRPSGAGWKAWRRRPRASAGRAGGGWCECERIAGVTT